MNKIIKISAVLSLLMITASAVAVAPAQVPATGETGGATGSNKGVAWLSPRFVVGTGATADCITDTLTGLIWPKNGIIGFESTNGGGLIAQPNYANTDSALNQITWVQALTAVANMNTATTKLCGYSDWRLPNVIELKSLVNYGQAYPAVWLNLPAQGFSNVQLYYYWSSSTYAQNIIKAWTIYFLDGFFVANNKTAYDFNVWPVRGGL